MPQIKTPENLESQKEIKPVDSPDPLKKIDPGAIANSLWREVQKAQTNRQPQIENHQRWYEKRMGIRPPKSFPFPDCSNIHIPVTDKGIKKIVPLYTSLVDTPGKTAIFRPAPNNPQLIKSVGRAEKFFTHLVQDVMNSHPEALGISEQFALGADKMCEKGYFIAKTVWSTVYRRRSRMLDIDALIQQFAAQRQNGRLAQPQQQITRDQITDEQITQQLVLSFRLSANDAVDKREIDRFLKAFRAGKNPIEIKFFETHYNAPMVIARDPKVITTPPDTNNLASSRWIDDQSSASSNDLRLAANSGKYDSIAVEEYLAFVRETQKKEQGVQQPQSTQAQATDVIDTLKRQREGIMDVTIQEDIHIIHETGFYFDINDDMIEEKCIITYPEDRPDLVFRFIQLPYDHGEWPWVDFPFELADERYTAPRGIPELLDHLQTVITSRHNFKLDSMTIMNAPMLTAIIGAANPGNIRYRPGDTIPVTRHDAIQAVTWERGGVVFEEREETILRSMADEYIGLIDQQLQSPLNPTQEARTKTEIQAIQFERSRIFSHSAKIFLKRLRKVYEQIWSLWIQYGPPELEVFATGELLRITKQEFGGKFYIFPAGSPETASQGGELQAAMGDLQLFGNDPSINQTELRNRYWRIRDPLAFDLMVIEPAQLQSSQVERQVLELTQMELGFDVPLKSDDDDATHLKVIQKWLQDIQSGKRRVSEETLRMGSSHGKFHQARILQRQGQSGQAEKARTEGNQARGLPE